MKKLLIVCWLLLSAAYPMIHNYSQDNSLIIVPQVRVFSDVPKDLLDNLGNMEVNDSIILNEPEGQFINYIFQTEAHDINMVGKKVEFLGLDKAKYFDCTRRDSIIVGGSCLYIFNDVQKDESGGYDAAVTCWYKFALPMQDIVREVKNKANFLEKAENK